MSALDDFHDEATAYLGYLKSLLPDAYELTLVARHTAMSADKNADIVITRDDPAALRRCIDRLMMPGDEL